MDQPPELEPVERPPADWYKELAAHLGSAYLRYSFTMGTVQECDFLWDILRLSPGMRVLDVGCGPGRHSIELSRRGADVVGIDISPDFLAVARSEARSAGVTPAFFEADATQLPFEDEFDCSISICEGAFGLGLDDLAILKGMRRALKPRGVLAAASANVFYVLRHLAPTAFDPVKMLYKESSEVIGDDGSRRTFEMWNSCYTPRELEWLANGSGLDPQVVYGIEPGSYGQSEPTFDHPELLLVATKPAGLV